MLDLSGKVIMKQLVERLNVPWNDVDVALATVRPVQVKNARWYDASEAAKAMEAYYIRRINGYTEYYQQRGLAISQKRADTCQQRLDRVREYLAELEAGQEAKE